MSAPLPPPVPLSAEQLDDELPDYAVRRLVGQGGMGAVYLAHHTTLDRDVAIKLLPAELAADEGFVRRSEREARSMARMDHPHIVRVHDFGRTSGGLPYLIMAYVDGCDLHRLIQRGELSVAQALQLVTQVCDALSYAHAAGIVHRDIKPSNVLLDRVGNIKIADFGLARPMGSQRSAAGIPLTRSGQVMGTLEYMAPEQLMGKEADHRADIYALGVMLYELLTGDVPRGAWSPPSGVKPMDQRLDAVVQRALQPKPEDRYQQAAEVKRDVTGVLEARAHPPPAKQKGKGGLLAGLCLATLAAAWQWRTPVAAPVESGAAPVPEGTALPIPAPAPVLQAPAPAPQPALPKVAPQAQPASAALERVLGKSWEAEGAELHELVEPQGLRLRGQRMKLVLRSEMGALDFSGQAEGRWQVRAQLGAANEVPLILTLQDEAGRRRSWRLKAESFNVGSSRLHTHFLTLSQADYVNAQASYGPKMEDHGFDLSKISAVIWECIDERPVDWLIESLQVVGH